MGNKSLFTLITLALILVVGFFFYNNQVSQLESEVSTITKEYNSKIEIAQSSSKPSKIKDKTSISTLEDLNNQLVSARSALKEAQQKLSIATSKSSVLNDEISQINDARGEVKVLEKELTISDEKLTHLKNIFEKQNKLAVQKNMERIKVLKETSTGIVLTGLVVPAVGVVTLVSYTIEEIDNYCSNIKNTMVLEEKIFGKVVSLDVQMKNNYHKQCVVSLKDKIKQQITKL
jgi:predicted PurR-regulated permease PerM